MALTKIKLDEVDTKATPVLADSVLMSDSEDDGRGKLVTGTALKDAMATNLVTTDTAQTVSGEKTFRTTQYFYGPEEAANHYAIQIGAGTTPLWRIMQYSGGNLVFQCKPTNSEIWQNALSLIFQSGGTIPWVQLYNNATGITQAQGNNSTRLATTEFVQAATASAIYDLPVTRSGLASPGTDVVLFETGVLDPAWYDETHVLNVSFFARNNTGISDSTVFRFQLYDESTSTAYTVASVTGDSLKPLYMQASIYRASPTSVNCNASYGSYADTGFVTLASGSYKLRVVCNSSLLIVFSGAQVRFTK